jgi:protein phosphatase
MNVVSEAKRTTVRAGGVTDRGQRRKHNEDFLLIRSDLRLFVVADGVGGLNAGEVASSLAAHSMSNFFEATHDGTSWPDSYRALLDLTLEQGARRLCAAVRKANADVFSIANSHREHRKMKSTIVAAHLSADARTLDVAHVGDSRCYRLRDGELELLTVDHTLRNLARLELPDISDERISQIPENMLSRALGQAEHIEIDITSHDVKPGDRYLLCSDGVTHMVDDDVIRECMSGPSPPKTAAEKLVARANQAGGRDNITALVVAVGSA